MYSTHRCVHTDVQYTHVHTHVHIHVHTHVCSVHTMYTPRPRRAVLSFVSFLHLYNTNMMPILVYYRPIVYRCVPDELMMNAGRFLFTFSHLRKYLRKCEYANTVIDFIYFNHLSLIFSSHFIVLVFMVHGRLHGWLVRCGWAWLLAGVTSIGGRTERVQHNGRSPPFSGVFLFQGRVLIEVYY
jgi:hypothetical protein